MASIKGRCEPAYSVVRRLGGVTRTALLLSLSSPAVSRWLVPFGSFGTGGKIPQKYWDDILAFSNRTGIAIDIYDLSGTPRP